MDKNKKHTNKFYIDLRHKVSAVETTSLSFNPIDIDLSLDEILKKEKKPIHIKKKARRKK